MRPNDPSPLGHAQNPALPRGADGRPYALALSDHGVAARLARRFGGEVIDTLVDNHATLPIPPTPEEEREAAIEALLRGVDGRLGVGTAPLSVTRPAEALREAFAKWKEAR